LIPSSIKPLIAVAAALAFFGCGADDPKEASPTTTTTSATTSAAGVSVTAACRAMAQELDEIDSLMRLYIDQIRDATSGAAQDEFKAEAARVEKDNLAPQRDAKIAALAAQDCNYHKGLEEVTGTFSPPTTQPAAQTPPTTPTGAVDVKKLCDDLYEKFSTAAANRDDAFQRRDYVLRDQYQAEAVRWGNEMGVHNCYG
jgi:hypothetical protein